MARLSCVCVAMVSRSDVYPRRDGQAELCLCVAMVSHPAIAISELSSHIARLKADDCRAFSAEYESIEPGQQFTWDASGAEENRAKNRYANVIAYDHSRVKLDSFDPLPMPGADYINANFIDGYCKPNAYIATQV